VRELPVPEDDGAADHLPGARLPAVELPATDGSVVTLDRLTRLTGIFVHPAIGGPEGGSLEEWTAIPGARGCTPEACSFRDQLAGFRAAGCDVLGLSGQSSARQREAVGELELPYPLLSDEELRLADLLPTFEFDGATYYRRLTLIVADAAIEAALYPVFPPEGAAHQALSWIAERDPRP
jgi:peroxiredoxin